MSSKKIATESIGRNLEALSNLKQFIADFRTNLTKDFDKDSDEEPEQFPDPPQATCPTTPPARFDFQQLLDEQERGIQGLAQDVSDTFVDFMTRYYEKVGIQNEEDTCQSSPNKSKNMEASLSNLHKDSSEVTDSGLASSLATLKIEKNINLPFSESPDTDNKLHLEHEGHTCELMIDETEKWRLRANRHRLRSRSLTTELLSLKSKLTTDKETHTRQQNNIVQAKNELNEMMKQVRSRNASLDSDNEILRFRNEQLAKELTLKTNENKRLKRRLKTLETQMGPALDFMDEAADDSASSSH